MVFLLAIAAFLQAHSATVVGVGGYSLAQVGNTMPDLGTPSYFKVWAHDYFKAMTASNKKKI